MNTKDQVAAKISSFKTLPATAQRLLMVAGSPESDIHEVTKVIEYDPALTANVLRAANSAYIGLSTVVTSLTEAMLRLGTKFIYQVAVSSLVYSNVKRPASGYDLSAEELWRHSAAVGIMSDALSKLLKIKDAGAIYTAGLLHDMGKIAMGEFVFESFDEIQAKVDSDNMTFEEAENEVLGVDHAEIGAMIAEHWNLPKAIVETIRWHHKPSAATEQSPAIDVVHVADAVCVMQGFGLGRDGMQYRSDEAASARLDLTSAVLEQATIQLLDALTTIEEVNNQPITAEVARR
jgi:putative nucleotidyltransferase with HDIG domain